MNRDVQLLTEQLSKIVTDAALIQKHLEDLHSVAYERGAGGGDQVSGTRRPVYNDEVGSAQAKAVWHRATTNLADAGQRLEKTRVAFEAVLRDGPGFDESMRGTFLGMSEFNRLVALQQQRRARGEYSPTKNDGVEQPDFPKVGELCFHCKELPAAKMKLCQACYAYFHRCAKLPSAKILKARLAR